MITAAEYLAELRRMVEENPSMLRTTPLSKEEAERELRCLRDSGGLRESDYQLALLRLREAVSG